MIPTAVGKKAVTKRPGRNLKEQIVTNSLDPKKKAGEFSNFLCVIGRAKRAPHWGVQSRFRVIYIIYVVGMSYVCRMSN